MTTADALRTFRRVERELGPWGRLLAWFRRWLFEFRLDHRPRRTTMNTTKLTADTITDDQIRALRNEAGVAGDLRTDAICVLALGGIGALEGADPGTEQDLLLGEGRDEQWARASLAEAINSARAMED